MKRIVFALASIIALSAISCSSTPTQTATDTTDSHTDISSELITENSIPLPEIDFQESNIQFYIASDRTKMICEKETGDTIEDAVYRRNRKIEERFNCKFAYNANPCNSETWGEWYSTLESSIMAGDNSVDIAGGYAYRFSALTLTSGLFQNLLDLPQMNMSQPWWPGNITEAACVGSKLFMAQGNIDPAFYDRIYALVFNKEMAKSLQLDFYGLVNNGDWTFDKLQEVAALAVHDIDGNSSYDDKDQWGFVTGNNMSIDAFNFAFDIDFVEYDKDGIPSLLPLSEKLSDACIQMKNFTQTSGTVWYCLEDEKQIIFNEDRALLMTNNIMDIQTMRSLETDFGIIPYPKWDEQQDEYLSFSAGVDTAVSYAIPITADGEKNSIILEALAYYGYNDILPEYYEIALKGKSIRDDESEQMLDLIFNNISFDFCQLYSYAFGDQKAPTMLMRMTIKLDKEITSMYNSDKKLYEKTIAMLIDSLE